MSNPYSGASPNPYGPGPGQPQPYAQQPQGGQYSQQPQGGQYAQQPQYQQAPPAQPAQQAPPAQQPGTFVCPKCRATMRTYNRNGIQIEQCDSCRGIFLDFGELEGLTRLEGNMGGQVAPPPVQQQHYTTGYGAGWASHGNHHYRPSGFSRLFFST